MYDNGGRVRRMAAGLYRHLHDKEADRPDNDPQEHGKQQRAHPHSSDCGERQACTDEKQRHHKQFFSYIDNAAGKF